MAGLIENYRGFEMSKKHKELVSVVNERFGNTSKILKSNNFHVLIKFQKGEYIQYATLAHNWNDVFWGHYFIVYSIEEDAEIQQAALKDYLKRH